MQRKEQGSALGFRKLKRRVMSPTRFQRQSMHASWRLVESTRQRLELPLPKDHEDHIAGKGYNSMTHYNLAHKFIPMLQAMEILDAESAGG